MAASRRRTEPAVIDRVKAQPQRFHFIQAVRLLEWNLLRQQAGGPGARASVGHQGPLDRESIRFEVPPSLAFPPSSVVSVQPDSAQAADGASGQMRMAVSFMGLSGAAGVLPNHYTTLLLGRIRKKDFALRDWFDLFNHRLLSMFYRASTKYRLPLVYERHKTQGSRSAAALVDAFYGLVGLGTDDLRTRMPLNDEIFIYFSGHFSHKPRNAISLELMLRDYFDLPVRVIQFCGQWLNLAPHDRSKMPDVREPAGRNSQLGLNTVLGERIWDVQGKFRVRLGPLTYAQYRRFLPCGDALPRLTAFIRLYVGPELDFDVQPVLLAAEVPGMKLGGDPSSGGRLGWNTWIKSGSPSRDFDEALFSESDCKSI